MAIEAMRHIEAARKSIETQRGTKAWEAHEPIMYVLDELARALESMAREIEVHGAKVER